MSHTDHLLARLDAIGQALLDTGRAQALIGLGSVGLETERIDAWSDLDFFAVVDPGAKAQFIGNLDWLAAARPRVWHFQNTVDGHKALMDDGVFCEFAVFEPHELEHVPFAPGRVVCKREGVHDAIARPREPMPWRELPGEEWIVGEALSCPFIGLQRRHRGESLSAARCVQGHALDRLLELDARRHPEADDGADPFNRERRLERRRPALAGEPGSLGAGLRAGPGG